MSFGMRMRNDKTVEFIGKKQPKPTENGECGEMRAQNVSVRN